VRPNLTTDIDGALSTRNMGSRGFHEVARSGNGNMRTDLLAEDGKDYEELEAAEQVVEDRGSVFRPYRDLRPGEKPPHSPRPGMAWAKRRIRTNSRRPGGRPLVRERWIQVSPRKWDRLRSTGQVLEGLGGEGLGIDLVTVAAAAGAAVLACMLLKK
jgi:hypothetical protein